MPVLTDWTPGEVDSRQAYRRKADRHWRVDGREPRPEDAADCVIHPVGGRVLGKA